MTSKKKLYLIQNIFIKKKKHVPGFYFKKITLTKNEHAKTFTLLYIIYIYYIEISIKIILYLLFLVKF